MVLAVAASGAVAAEGEGTVEVARGQPLLLRSAKGLDLVTLARGAELTGVEGLHELQPGDAVRYSWSVEVAGVRQAWRLAVDPVLAVDAELDVLPGKLEQELGEGGAVPVDARTREAWERGHLPGALSVPWDAPDAALRKLLGVEGLLVVHGESERTREAHALVRRLSALGRTEARILRGGFRAWDREGLPAVVEPAAVAREFAKGSPWIAVDVRAAAAATASPLAGSVAIPLDEFRPGEFSGREELPPIIFVGGAERDGDAFEAAMRVTRWRADPDLPSWSLRVLGGGAAAWLQARLAAPPGASRGPLRWTPPPSPATVGGEEFRALWAEKGANRLLLDVRTPPRRSPSWVGFVPLEELAVRLGELPRDREIVVFCTSGRRARVARELLVRNGRAARYLEGGLPEALP